MTTTTDRTRGVERSPASTDRTSTATAAGPPEPSGGPRWAEVLPLALRFALVLGIGLLVVVFSSRTDLFLTTGNLRNIALASAVLLVVAVPSALLVVMGYVDLSVGSSLALTAVVCGTLINGDTSWPVAVLAACAVGALVGLVNGVLVTVVGLNALIVTLAGMQLLRGAAETVAVSPPYDFGRGMALLGRGLWLGVPVPVWAAIAVFAAGAVFLYLTPTGRHTYAIGVSREAAYLSGLRVRLLPLLVFVATGAAAGLGGVLTAARLDSAPASTLAVGFEIQVLTVVLLGGVAFTGGRGTVTGVLLGVVFLGVLQNGLVLMNVSSNGQKLATGAALLLAAGLDAMSERSATRRLVGRRREPAAATPAPTPTSTPATEAHDG